MPIFVYLAAIITQRIHGFHESSMTWKKDRESQVETFKENELADTENKVQKVQGQANVVV